MRKQNIEMEILMDKGNDVDEVLTFVLFGTYVMYTKHT